MNHDTTTGALTMHWVTETDAEGRTHLVAHWATEVPVIATTPATPIEVGHAA